jgi:hypothetical protein
MSASFARATQLVEALVAAGVRATVDPSAVNPPAVLVVPPTRAYDIGCGFTATWSLVALAPAGQGADRTTWAQLDALVDAVAAAVALERAELVAYTLNGTSLPAYRCTFQEAIE